ncbi:Origin of replication complex subunit 4-like protein [Drosera capensis]
MWERKSWLYSGADSVTPISFSLTSLGPLTATTVTETCNNSVLLLGPRGCGKSVVLELVIADLLAEFPDMISVIKLNGRMHTDDNCALKASFDDNSEFMISMLRECGLAHKTIIFVLDEFDLFAQGKQKLLYSLLDAMQSVTSQAAVVGISCRLDADQLLEKRVRSRFSHRKLLFFPPSEEDCQRLLEHIFFLPVDSTLPSDHAAKFNMEFQKIIADDGFKDIICSLFASDSTVHSFLRFLFSAVSSMDLKSGFPTLENFKSALHCVVRQPKFEYLKDCSHLELYLLVCMKRLEVKEKATYNFNSVMEEYKTIRDRTLPHGRGVCLRAFEHLLQSELISFTDGKGHNQSIQFRPVKLLISFHQLHQRLKLNDFSNSHLLKLFDQAGQKC